MSNDQYKPELDITNYVSKFREMDPETEDLIADGEDLKNGMRVLIADPMNRKDVSHGFNDSLGGVVVEYLLDRAKERNRWCTVSQLSYRDEIVSFVAIYDDGTKRKRTYNCSWAWFVKLDSMPKTLAEASEENLPTSSDKTCGDKRCVCHETDGETVPVRTLDV